jgi:hypothetical protein
MLHVTYPQTVETSMRRRSAGHGVTVGGVVQCATCMLSSTIVQDGELKRFCQRCACLQPLEDFDGFKRSCRISLMKHNYLRRKMAKNGNAASREATFGAEVTPSWQRRLSWVLKLTHECPLVEDKAYPNIVSVKSICRLKQL